MANNFTADANCKALWRFENGALTTDSKGTNTLTNSGVTSDTTNHVEGDGCGSFVASESDYMTIPNASLAAGFPMKSGDTIKIISASLKFRLTSLPASGQGMALFGIYDSTNNKRTFLLYLYNNGTNTHIMMNLGHTGGTAAETITHAYGLSTGVWYYLLGTYEDAGKSYTLRLKTNTGTTLGTDLLSTATNNINIEDAPLYIGVVNPTPTYYLDGLIDEIVVFNDVITEPQATQIAQGTYGRTRPIYLGQPTLGKQTLGGRLLS